MQYNRFLYFTHSDGEGFVVDYSAHYVYEYGSSELSGETGASILGKKVFSRLKYLRTSQAEGLPRETNKSLCDHGLSRQIDIELLAYDGNPVR